MLVYVGLNDMRAPTEKQVIHLIDTPKTSVVIKNHTVQLEELNEVLRSCMSWKVAATNEIKA